jgi:hypothetical protein
MRYSYAAELEKEEHVFTDEDELVESLRTGFWEAARKNSEEPRDDDWDVPVSAGRTVSQHGSGGVAAR